jgi:hypothetical protein
VLRFGGEKALTKHHMTEDSTTKCSIPFDEATKLLDEMKILNHEPPVACKNVIENKGSVESVPHLPKAETIKTIIKAKLGRNLNKLFDLDPDRLPEKPINVEFCVDLYQMEDY